MDIDDNDAFAKPKLARTAAEIKTCIHKECLHIYDMDDYDDVNAEVSDGMIYISQGFSSGMVDMLMA